MSGKAIGKNFDLGYAGNVSRDRDNIIVSTRYIVWTSCGIK